MSERTPPFRDPRMRGFRVRSTVADVLRRIDESTDPLGPERVALAEAGGRVLAEAVVAGVDVPHFDRAAMDGYAVRGEETFGSDRYTPALFRLIGRARPGRAFAGVVRPGEAVEITTGSPIPVGADTVVKVELTDRSDATIRVFEPVPPGRDVGRRGEDIERGTPLFEPGRRLRPQDLGVLSALGRPEIVVVRRPSVSVLITGDELLPSGSPPVGHAIPDMNSAVLTALLNRDGADPTVVGPIDDLRERLSAAIEAAVASSDLVLVSGGSSTGPEDHAPSIVAELGDLPVHGVALRPAGPVGIGRVRGVPIVLLPGNPVSCLCAYDFFAGRIVRRLGGRPPDWPYRSVGLPLGSKLVSALGRVDYARVKVEDGRVLPISSSGASILSSTTRADGFVVVPAEREGYAEGPSVVTVWLYEIP